MVAKPETALVRPFIVCAVLRGVQLDESRYNSFIDLQVRSSRLHQVLEDKAAFARRGDPSVGLALKLLAIKQQGHWQRLL